MAVLMRENFYSQSFHDLTDYCNCREKLLLKSFHGTNYRTGLFEAARRGGTQALYDVSNAGLNDPASRGSRDSV